MEWDGFHSLVERARCGDRAALGELLARVRPELERQVAQAFGPEWKNNSFEDLVQKACLREMEKLPGFVGGADDEQTCRAFLKWSAKVVYHLVLNHLRGKNAPTNRPPGGVASIDRPGTEDESQGAEKGILARDPSASQHLRDKERDDLIAEALSKLDPADQEIVRLHYFEDLPFSTIAERLGLTCEQVRYRHKLLLERLEGPLAGWGIERGSDAFGG
jgi:RNA polymerase sigma factor (sigma-70 family)